MGFFDLNTALNLPVFLSGVVILAIGVVLFGAKSAVAKLVGAIVVAAGTFTSLSGVKAIDGSFTILMTLIILAVGLIRTVGTKSVAVTIIAIVVAVFVIVAILGMVGTFPVGSPIGTIWGYFVGSLNAIIAAIFH